MQAYTAAINSLLNRRPVSFRMKCTRCVEKRFVDTRGSDNWPFPGDAILFAVSEKKPGGHGPRLVNNMGLTVNGEKARRARAERRIRGADQNS